MRLVTWNVNSVRTRIDRVIGFLERSNTDVLAIQETKCRVDQFPYAPFEEAGYEVAVTGLNQWNGVALISRVGIENVRTQFEGQPAFAKPDQEPVVEPRAIGATCGGIDVWSLYVPNGRSITDPHYAYKLSFLTALAEQGRSRLADDPSADIALVGDWNVAPQDHDVWDIELFQDNLYVTDGERRALQSVVDAGFAEVTREHEPDQYTFWEYQQLRFPRNEGMRIDFQHFSPSLAGRVAHASIDRDERKGKGASDHVPVIVDIED
ncbi:exodeoxyribonuclease III [Flaviflexus salsibiostraticola]|uniref:Exodeoxyribonuclease III n=1 Tax=Flaviflexus salsibiostraticola TaxID=1282737 RepID=A0A3S8Z9R3_9ACTO|nr:exodeoxyribonuclease III [Flaviflexus salsibiostraticola]AZN30125.1 exodeoxyribonuclease III [Flaviflexus salsibiostraticola]